jgi:DNA invertase Pin-like site-specific DNA recombinase
MAGMAEFERTLMLQRQREGIAEAKKQGKYKGRKQIDKPSNWKDLYEQYRTRQITATALAKDLNVSRSLLYQWLKAEQK